MSELTCLTCPQHEEADTRIFAHAAYSVSSQGCTRVVIKATDTDIAILGVYHSQRMPGLEQLWIQKSVTAENPDVPTSVFLPCHQITDMLSSKYPEVDITSVVLTAYTITGCDTVSYPFRIGKKRALKCALENRDVLETMANYGEPDGCLQPMPEVLQSARKFYFALYGRRDYSGTLDELRCHLFITKKGDLRSLPCTEDAFTFHAQRALHQLVIYKRATQPDPLLPDALELGRYLHDGCLISKRTTKSAKPYIAKTYCKCKNGKCGDKCPCHRAGPDCNIGCLCSGDPLKCSRFTTE